ncbi:hypothetical protein H4S00_002622 [Coemansia sp. D1744]|nr:hypothetical protein H4S00_002622 [Coemansia sp. D1744]
MVRQIRMSGPMGLSRTILTHVPEYHGNTMNTEITGRAIELEEAEAIPEPEDQTATPTPDEPTVVDIDDDFFTDSTNVTETGYYPFPLDSELRQECIVVLQEAVEPESASNALELAMLKRMLAADMPREQQRGLVDDLNHIFARACFGPEIIKLRHMEAMFKEQAQGLVSVSCQYYHCSCGCKLLRSGDHCTHSLPAQSPKLLKYFNIQYQLAGILHAAVKAEMLENQLAKASLPNGKKLVRLDTIHLSLGVDGFNATKATVTSVGAVAIRVLNLPFGVQNRTDYMIIPVVLPISKEKQNEASFLRPVVDTLYRLEQGGLQVVVGNTTIMADIRLHSITGDTPQLAKMAGRFSHTGKCLHVVLPKRFFTDGNAALGLHGNSDYGFDRFANNNGSYFFTIDELHLFGHGIAGRLLDGITTKPTRDAISSVTTAKFGNLLYIPTSAWNDIQRWVVAASEHVSNTYYGFSTELFVGLVQTWSVTKISFLLFIVPTLVAEYFGGETAKALTSLAQAISISLNYAPQDAQQREAAAAGFAEWHKFILLHIYPKDKRLAFVLTYALWFLKPNEFDAEAKSHVRKYFELSRDIHETEVAMEAAVPRSNVYKDLKSQLNGLQQQVAPYDDYFFFYWQCKHRAEHVTEYMLRLNEHKLLHLDEIMAIVGPPRLYSTRALEMFIGNIKHSIHASGTSGFGHERKN